MAGLITSALGQIADSNVMAFSTIGGGVWSSALPLANILNNAKAAAPRHIGAPARCLQVANLSASRFDIVMDRVRGVSLVGLLFHTLSLDALFRIRTADLTGSLDAPDWISDWRPVYGPLYDSADLPWEAPNWWSGQIEQDDLDLYPRHLWIPTQLDGQPIDDPQPRVCGKIRIEIDDHLSSAPWFDVGGVFIASTFSPVMNFDRGRTVGLEARSRVDEAPAGRRFPDNRRARRVHNVSWSFLTKAEAWKFFDASVRAGSTAPVLFIPDAGDELSLPREAFPGFIEKAAEPRFVREGEHVVTATIKEIIA